jgi:uncharacterized protein YecT (DUF1311 family)
MPRHINSARKLAAAAFGMLLSCTPALAIDCSKAKTPVEVAICSDDKLGNQDDALERAYAGWIGSAKENEFHRASRDVRTVQASQAKWLSEREKACGGKAADQLRDCVSTWTVDRTQWLTFESRLRPGDTLAVGAETLVIDVDGQGEMFLKHQGKVVIDVSDDFGAPPFTVLRRASGPGGAGILLEAGAAQGEHCSTIYLIWTSKAGLQSRDLGLNCIGFDPVSTLKTDRGLTFEEPVAPYRDGKETDWDVQSGEVSDHFIRFQPTPGTSMLDLISSGNALNQEPLKNQEFFDAAGKLPADDRKRLVTALWQITADCSTCLDEAGRGHYGVIIEPDGAAYSGCGMFMYGGDLRCGDIDALAVWERKTGSFYFTWSRHQKPGGAFPPVQLASFPPMNQWSDYAKAKSQLWDRGANWVKRGD